MTKCEVNSNFIIKERESLANAR